jgi:hypothetical protein
VVTCSANSEIGIHLFGGRFLSARAHSMSPNWLIGGDVLEIRVKLSRHGLIDAVFASCWPCKSCWWPSSPELCPSWLDSPSPVRVLFVVSVKVSKLPYKGRIKYISYHHRPCIYWLGSRAIAYVMFCGQNWYSMVIYWRIVFCHDETPGKERNAQSGQA